jgi:hypothetical protein
MFLHAYTYEQNEPVVININQISCIYRQSRFAELSVHMKDGTFIVIRGELWCLHNVMDVKSVSSGMDKLIHDIGILMQKTAIDPVHFSLEERLKAIENVVEHFDLEKYPLDDFKSQIKEIREEFLELVMEKFNVQQANS